MTKPNCQALLHQLSGYLDGDLEAVLCAEIERHLAACDNCRVVVNTLAKTVMLYRHLPPADLSGEARARLFKVLKLDRRRH